MLFFNSRQCAPYKGRKTNDLIILIKDRILASINSRIIESFTNIVDDNTAINTTIFTAI